MGIVYHLCGCKEGSSQVLRWFIARTRKWFAQSFFAFVLFSLLSIYLRIYQGSCAFTIVWYFLLSKIPKLLIYMIMKLRMWKDLYIKLQSPWCWKRGKAGGHQGREPCRCEWKMATGFIGTKRTHKVSLDELVEWYL